MDPRTRAIAIAGSVGILIFIIELLRRRRLKEEYSVLWLATGLVLLVLAVWDGLLDEISNAIGSALATSTMLFFGLGFVMVMLLHFSVRVSLLERQLTTLVQEIGLIRADQSEEPGRRDAPAA
jgi:hypothetical protein